MGSPSWQHHVWCRDQKLGAVNYPSWFMFPERSLKKSDHVLFCGGPALESDTTPCAVLCCWWWDISLYSILDYFDIFGLTMHPSFMFWHLLVYNNDWEWILTCIWWLFWRNPTVAIAWLVFLMDPRRPFLGETSSWNLPPYQHDRHAEETWTGSGEWTEEIPGYSPKHPDKF